MEAAKHNPEFAAKLGIPQKVAADFVAADKSEGKFQGSKSKPSRKGK